METEKNYAFAQLNDMINQTKVEKQSLEEKLQI
jgi:hypothetical protein